MYVCTLEGSGEDRGRIARESNVWRRLISGGHFTAPQRLQIYRTLAAGYPIYRSNRTRYRRELAEPRYNRLVVYTCICDISPRNAQNSRFLRGKSPTPCVSIFANLRNVLVERPLLIWIRTAGCTLHLTVTVSVTSNIFLFFKHQRWSSFAVVDVYRFIRNSYNGDIWRYILVCIQLYAVRIASVFLTSRERWND